MILDVPNNRVIVVLVADPNGMNARHEGHLKAERGGHDPQALRPHPVFKPAATPLSLHAQADGGGLEPVRMTHRQLATGDRASRCRHPSSGALERESNLNPPHGGPTAFKR